MYKHFFKRVLDFLIAMIVLIILSPFFIIVMIILFFTNDGKPFFVQVRPGKNEKLFKILKFRTMNGRRDRNGALLSDAERLTKIGQLVRKSSFDEIPQLINVLKGEMSLVGPRPLLPQYLPLYNQAQKLRHDVKPGITGWAQVNGRNAINWQQKFNFDIWYVENLSFMLDFKILLLTVRKVFIREGIATAGTVTAEAFKGN